MRPGHALLVGGVVPLLWAAQALGWSEQTHRRMTADALQDVAWLDRYRKLEVTPFAAMLRDVAGKAEPVESGAFRFRKRGTRQARHRAYLSSTQGISDAAVRRFARHLLLSKQTRIRYALGEQRGPVSARQVLAGYSGEPDWGMDKGLNASWHQAIMGGTRPGQTSSQGFRHMSFLLGALGEAPNRAQLFFDLGRRAIERGHGYWGFRFVAWGLHYLQDMGTPVHTSMLPTLKYIRLRGMLRPRGKLNRGLPGDLIKGSTHINANYHFLYEHYIDRLYAGDKGSGAARTLSTAVRGRGGERGGWLGRVLRPRSVQAVARRRGWSRLSTPAIARNAVRFFTGRFRQPAPGAAPNTVGLVDASTVKQTVKTIDRPLAGESRRSHARRIRARDVMVRRTVGQFRKNGAAVRRAVGMLGRQLGRARR